MVAPLLAALLAAAQAGRAACCAAVAAVGVSLVSDAARPGGRRQVRALAMRQERGPPVEASTQTETEKEEAVEEEGPRKYRRRK